MSVFGKKNVIYSGCNVKLWIDVAKTLEQKYEMTPKYFIGRKAEFTKKNVEIELPGCYFQYTEDAWKGLGFFDDFNLVSLDEVTANQISHHILIGMRMIDRLDFFSSFTSTERQQWFINLIERWLGIIKTKEIDLIISPSIPHRVFDYALYVAAKIKNVNFVMFQMTQFGDASFIINDIDSTPDYLKVKMSSVSDKKLLDLPSVMQDTLIKFQKSYSDALPSYMVEQRDTYSDYKSLRFQTVSFLKDFRKVRTLFNKSETYNIFYGKHPEVSSMNKLTAYFMRKYGEIKKLKLKNKYCNYTSNINLDEKFIFVALHYQPEETSCPTGGFYVEQRQIIKNLLEEFPLDVRIYVKEHSSQFFPYFEGETGRTEQFYKDVSLLSERVSFIPLDFNTFKLVDNSLAVATISGTIGWESIFRLKPVLLFGRSWYEDMPGVYKVKSIQNLSKAKNEILNLSYLDELSLDKLYGAHYILAQSLIYSGHYQNFYLKRLTSNSRSVDNIVAGLIDFIKCNEK
jgi:hypothetical protein